MAKFTVPFSCVVEVGFPIVVVPPAFGAVLMFVVEPCKFVVPNTVVVVGPPPLPVFDPKFVLPRMFVWLAAFVAVAPSGSL